MSDQVLIAVIGAVASWLTILTGFIVQYKQLRKNTEISLEARDKAFEHDGALGTIKHQTNGRVSELVAKVEEQALELIRLRKIIDRRREGPSARRKR